MPAFQLPMAFWRTTGGVEVLDNFSTIYAQSGVRDEKGAAESAATP